MAWRLVGREEGPKDHFVGEIGLSRGRCEA
jgi:hypothetical protein